MPFIKYWLILIYKLSGIFIFSTLCLEHELAAAAAVMCSRHTRSMTVAECTMSLVVRSCTLCRWESNATERARVNKQIEQFPFEFYLNFDDLNSNLVLLSYASWNYIYGGHGHGGKCPVQMYCVAAYRHTFAVCNLESIETTLHTPTC